MLEILTVKSVVKKGKNSLVIFETGEETILSNDIVNKYLIKTGAELRTAELLNIKAESDQKRAEDYASYLISRREYSSGQLKNKLMLRGFNKELSDKTVLKLKQTGLIDDSRFARQTVESMLRNKPAGRAFMIAYLRSKFIPREMAVSIVDEIIGNVDENELALKILKGRWRQFSKFDLETARKKAYNYLSRRSVSYGAAKYAFEEMIKEVNED